MSIGQSIPIPPPELRLVGPRDPEDYDNPSGEPIFPDLPLNAYDAVFDFGCGCGRLARQLLQQKRRPRRYVGVDVHKGMIDWSIQNLSPVDCNFQFFYQDVYSPGYAPGNSLRLAAPFPVADGEFTLVIALSVFTHLIRPQIGYYLSEVARILKPGGVAFTSWFFFDNESFPFNSKGPYCLYTDESDLSAAVIYDRKWCLDEVRRAGLGVRRTQHPNIPGHQWIVWLEKRTHPMEDQFPLGEEGAEYLCGATRRPMALATASEEEIRHAGTGSKRAHSPSAEPSKQVVPTKPQPPDLFGPLAELAAIKRSWIWRSGRAITKPFRVVRGFFHKE